MDKVQLQSIISAALTGLAVRQGLGKSTGMALGAALVAYWVADKVLVESRDNGKVDLHSREPQTLHH